MSGFNKDVAHHQFCQTESQGWGELQGCTSAFCLRMFGRLPLSDCRWMWLSRGECWHFTLWWIAHVGSGVFGNIVRGSSTTESRIKLSVRWGSWPVYQSVYVEELMKVSWWSLFVEFVAPQLSSSVLSSGGSGWSLWVALFQNASRCFNNEQTTERHRENNWHLHCLFSVCSFNAFQELADSPCVCVCAVSPPLALPLY